MAGKVPVMVSTKRSVVLLSKKLWRPRLNHIGDQHLASLEKHVDGLTLDVAATDDDIPCDACPAGKSKHPSFPVQAERPVCGVNHLLVTDLGGDMPADLNGNVRNHLFVDAYSREGFVYLLKQKSEAHRSLCGCGRTRKSCVRGCSQQHCQGAVSLHN